MSEKVEETKKEAEQVDGEINTDKSVVAQISDLTDQFFDGDFVFIDSEPNDKFSAIMRKVFGDVTKQSAAKQVAVGGVTGWVSGYLAKSVGRTAAVAVGATVIVIQVAQHKGYVTINWTKVQRAVTKARAEAEKKWNEDHKYRASIAKFYKENFYLASGFAGGFLFSWLW